MVVYRKALTVLFGPVPGEARAILFRWLQDDVAARWRLIAHELAQRATVAAIKRLDLLAYATTRMARRMGLFRGSPERTRCLANVAFADTRGEPRSRS